MHVRCFIPFLPHYIPSAYLKYISHTNDIWFLLGAALKRSTCFCGTVIEIKSRKGLGAKSFLTFYSLWCPPILLFVSHFNFYWIYIPLLFPSCFLALSSGFMYLAYIQEKGMYSESDMWHCFCIGSWRAAPSFCPATPVFSISNLSAVVWVGEIDVGTGRVEGLTDDPQEPTQN